MARTERELEERVIGLIDGVPVDGIFENMTYWTLEEEGWDVSREDIEQATTALVESGQLKLTGEINGYRRFKLEETAESLE